MAESAEPIGLYTSTMVIIHIGVELVLGGKLTSWTWAVVAGAAPGVVVVPLQAARAQTASPAARWAVEGFFIGVSSIL